MEKAYIILAHKNPNQLNRMIKRLNESHSYFYLHIDKNVLLKDFENIPDLPGKITMVESIETQWGSFGIVAAVLNAMKLIDQSGKIFDRIILLSGQDYPIKSNRVY